MLFGKESQQPSSASSLHSASLFPAKGKINPSMGKSEDGVSLSKSWLLGLSHGRTGHEIERLTLQGLQVVTAEKGVVRCTFVIPRALSDKDGYWHVGAIATIVDDIGAAAIATTEAEIKATVNFNISYLSTAKIKEEVEIEAKTLCHNGKLSSVQVEVRRKNNGELLSLGKLWMTSLNTSLEKSSKL